jgi:hypothetical protein
VIPKGTLSRSKGEDFDAVDCSLNLLREEIGQLCVSDSHADPRGESGNGSIAASVAPSYCSTVRCSVISPCCRLIASKSRYRCLWLLRWNYTPFEATAALTYTRRFRLRSRLPTKIIRPILETGIEPPDRPGWLAIGSIASRLRSTLVYERIALKGLGAVDVLDEQDLVAYLVIKEFVDGASGEKKTEATGW